MTPGDNVIGYLISWASIVTGILVSVSGQGTWWLAIAVAVQIIAWCAGASGVVCAALTAPVVITLAHAAVYRARRAVTADDALAMVCDPCHGKPGHCTCASKAGCPHPLCGAPDTGIDDGQFSRELAALLEEGKQQ